MSTAVCLRLEGFTVLSRDITATDFGMPGISELPVSVDWFGHRKGVRLTPREIGESLSKAASSQAPVGVMLHHALIDDEERQRIGELLELLSSHPRVHGRLMRDLVPSFERIATS